MTEPRPLASSLDAVLRGARRRPGVRRACGRVFTEWTALVGAHDRGAHARPVSLDGGCLLVVVDEPGWATRFRFEQASLLRRFADGARRRAS